MLMGAGDLNSDKHCLFFQHSSQKVMFMHRCLMCAIPFGTFALKKLFYCVLPGNT